MRELKARVTFAPTQTVEVRSCALLAAQMQRHGLRASRFENIRGAKQATMQFALRFVFRLFKQSHCILTCSDAERPDRWVSAFSCPQMVDVDCHRCEGGRTLGNRRSFLVR